MLTRSKNGIRKPKNFHTVVCGYVDDLVEPRTIREALKSDHWGKAAQEEYDALIRNNTWFVVGLPLDLRAVQCKWIFKIKRHLNGSVSRFKARLVAKGFLQQADCDFHEMLSPMVKPVTVHNSVTCCYSKLGSSST
ncbi:hypothetical protein HRI_001384900 [Hibiscus trionum]|uniref:Reverse transcriptase Ty1/copia-type domain-containing protein n=1 Tax=Hibiscus trionum TaxID=183268 RepID=A0A9W7HH72_HIBTR|nr:hypothetical protein HRI_001384900 [Hibiscus trionum]